MPRRALVVGFGITGRAVTRALRARGGDVVVVDDHPSSAARAAAESCAVDLLDAPTRAQLGALVREVDAILPSPGVPDSHDVFDLARAAAVPVMSEFDLARAWDDRPLLAVTGTDGKTTVTTMATAMLNASGRRAVAVGNTEVPLVEAIDDPEVDVFVVEASSFRLGHTQRFEPAVATWLNFAPDHLDGHRSLADYEAAKARIWADLRPDRGVAVANRDDPVVYRHVRPDVATVTFGVDEPGDFHVADGCLRAADGRELVTLDELPRSMPHDVSNALAASATALEGGATLDGVRVTLRTFTGLPHRVSLVGSWHGVSWYDDSKATTPQATQAAVRGLGRAGRVVLVAGGRNKGLDLRVLGDLGDRLRGVVAIGEAAPEVRDAFAGRADVVVADSMTEAVDAAARLARPGDDVVLSPACASFDWYADYAERGDDFAAAVRRLKGEVTP
ncbi:MAG TPA: UDP-N-acetylmuramoyl-L-alanine--D-glutamate ligase [Acidimicrobiales bacterium]|nr:UDP-N-acetylmuramoyl-L-alanine--D-glutamate ligase [Acidimicrobiales bacterium]